MNEKGEQAAREISETREKTQNFRVFRLFRVLLVLFETWVKAQPQKPIASGKLIPGGVVHVASDALKQ
jgi:hypothetical protein